MRLTLIVAFLLSLLALDPALAQTSARWATGLSFKRQLAENTGISATGIPLRKAICDLGRLRQVSILFDRRVDPDQPLTLTATDRPLEEILGQVARQHGLGMTVLGSVICLGPANHTARLRTLAELRRQEARARSDVAERLLSVAPIRWPAFALPRDVLSELAAEAGLTIEGLAQVPHDLWAEADLAPLAWVDRLTLVAGQFDLTFRVSSDGRSVVLVPIPDDVGVVRSYAVGSQASRLAEKWGQLLPGARIKVMDGKVFVRGFVEDHERLAASMGSATGTKAPVRKPVGTPPSREAEKRYTLKQAQGQLDLLLPQLADRLGVEVRIDRGALERAGISLRKQVSVSVSDATLDELFSAVLKPAGCTFRRQGNIIEVLPLE